ncbi:MAG: radical SAM protein [Geobacteraceae bacterium]
MSWKIKENYRQLLAVEAGTVIKNWGGKLTICLVYPNLYATAMSNLGFQAVYTFCNSLPDIVCERAFLPSALELKEYQKTGSRLLSLESQRPLSDFDVLAFSVSFENDYLNIPAIFDLAGIPPFALERDFSYPLVIAGGAALFLNPEPVAELLDLVCVGEGEAILPSLLDFLRTQGDTCRTELLDKALQLPGIYVPSRYEITYNNGGIGHIQSLGDAPSRVKRAWDVNLDSTVVASTLYAPGTEFSDMHLIEVSRGCPRGCRFCAAGFIYHPFRQRSLELLKKEAERGMELKERIGLVGAAVSDYRSLGELCRFIAEKGGKVSVSSLRIDALDENLLEILHASGHKTVALAPEGGSQRLRDLIRKDLSEEQILGACDTLIGRDILNLKLYFIIGLPTETEQDLAEMVELIEKIRQRVIAAAKKNRRLGSVLLSVNPFVPKPFTPLQWCGMESLVSLEKKYQYLRRAVGTLSNVKIQMESLREAFLQALLSRGDRRLSAFLVKAHREGGWKRAAKELCLAPETFVTRTIPLEETLPWDTLDDGERSRLVREYERAFQTQSV